jgi:uncharacterized protein YjdB
LNATVASRLNNYPGVTMRTTYRARAFASTVLLATGACGTESIGPTPAGFGSIEVVPSAATIAQGQPLQLTAMLFDEFGDPLQIAVTWSSSNPAVATVSHSGTVYGRQPGRAAVTANARGMTHSSAVRVVEGRAADPKHPF